MIFIQIKNIQYFLKKGRNILKSYVKTLNNQRGGAVREQNNNIVLRLGQRQPQQQRNVALHTQRNPPRHRVIWNTVYNPGSATSTGFYTVQDENNHLAHLTPEQWQNLAQQSPEVRIAYEDWALSRTPEQRQFYNRLPLQTRQALYNSRIQNLINPPMLASDYELMNENRNQANRQRPFGGNNPFYNYHLQQPQRRIQQPQRREDPLHLWMQQYRRERERQDRLYPSGPQQGGAPTLDRDCEISQEPLRNGDVVCKTSTGQYYHWDYLSAMASK